MIYEPEILKFNSKDIRVIDKDGEPWFLAKDVCTAFGFKSPVYEITKLDNDEQCICKVQTVRGAQDMYILSYFGLLSLLFKSKIPAAKRLSRWVVSEILLRIFGGFDDTGTNSVNDK